jgi:glycosyltransferase involved in cell wall biosynthesis
MDGQETDHEVAKARSGGASATDKNGGGAPAPTPDEIVRNHKAAADLVAMGNRCRDEKDWAGARANYEEALRLNSTLQPIWIQLGHAAKESGDLFAAEGAYRKALELEPGDADGHLQLGHLLKLRGQIAEALESYNRAMELDHRLTDAHVEISALRARVNVESHLGDAGALATPTYKSTRKAMPEGALTIVFDISDLMSYFHNLRLPTGIQRVQMEVIKSVMDNREADFGYSIVCFTPEADFWIEIPPPLFYRFCQFSVISGDVSAPEWRSLLAELDRVLKSGQHFRFPKGSLLVDLGSSWWLRNYFLNLRLAKSLYDVKYVPFMHDLIPVMTPEYCTPELRRDFLSWVTGAFDHADHFLANSEATLADLRTVGAKLGHEVPGAAVIKLDADFRKTLDETSHQAMEDAAYILESNDLKKGNYVLFVATIEARKNHIAAFSVWLKLIKKHGVRNVPKLVCVGNEGWLMDAAYATLSASEILTNHVLMLRRISDPALAVLYKNCLCTLYPSSYEGWGLPVTEALCYGKVPIISNVSSLPEAGGQFAEYFDIESEKDLLNTVERLVFDDAYRIQQEDKIAAKFRPRTWKEISEQIVDQLRAWHSAPGVVHEREDLPSAPGIWPVKAEMGMLQTLGGNSDSILWAGLKSGEIYRNGRSWWWPEPWGCWIKGTGPVNVAFVVEGVADEGLIVYIGLRGVTDKEATCTLKSEGARTVEVLLQANQNKVVAMELPPQPEDKRLVVITVGCNASTDFSIATKGRDNRISGAGVRWFYACKQTDLLARLAMLEALSLDDYKRLARQRPAKLDFFLHT